MVNLGSVKFDFGKDFDAALNATLAQAVKRRQDRIRKRLRTRVKQVANRYIKNSPVGRSLRGGGGNPEFSLQAELGLTDSAASIGIQKLVEVVQREIRISVRAAGGSRASGVSEISVLNLDSKEIEKGINFTSEEFSYKSRGGQIQWLKLVLNPNSAVLDEALPGIRKKIKFRKNQKPSYWKIVRGNDMEELEAVANRNPFAKNPADSRSGFALMAIGGTQPYAIPSILLPRGSGKNFLDEIFTSKSFRSEIRKEIREVINQELRK